MSKVTIDPHPAEATGVCEPNMIRCHCNDGVILQISETFTQHSQLIDSPPSPQWQQ